MTSVVDKKLSECFTEFTLDVYKNLANKIGSQNLFMSPSSISVVMTMVHAARGNNESQMRKTLKLENLKGKRNPSLVRRVRAIDQGGKARILP